MQYNSFDKDAILPDSTFWQYKPKPEIINKCKAIAEFPHISKSFTEKHVVIDYAEIAKYTKLFKSYDEYITSGYLNEGTPLYLPKIVDERIANLDAISDEYSKLIQFIYEVQCALTEFYVFVNKYQFQFRKTLLPLMDEETLKTIKPFMAADLEKSYGNNNAYVMENTCKASVVYDLYLRLSYSLNICFQYIFNADHKAILKDIKTFWLMCGYKNEIHSAHYDLINKVSSRYFKQYVEDKRVLFPNISEEIYGTLTCLTGSYQKQEDGVMTEYSIDQLFQPCGKFENELIDLFANQNLPSKKLGNNAILQITSDLPNPMIVNDGLFSFELSIFSNLEDHSTLMAEFVLFGGIYNHLRDCINYPLVFKLNNKTDLSNDHVNYFKDYVATIAQTLMLNYEHVLFTNQSTALENQLKKRMAAQMRN